MPGIERAVVVTGAASGIGRAAAELFSERGYGVVAVDLEFERLAWTAEHENILALAGDVATEDVNAEMVAMAVAKFGRLDAAILNAGVGGNPPIEHANAIRRFDEMMAVNLRAVVLGIAAAVPAMRAAGGGAIVATASTSGIRADPGMWAYNASKGAVVNLVRSVAMDYATQGIRINAVAPGPIETGMTVGLRARTDISEEMRRRIPMQRWGLPREVAEVMWFLASPAASFVTGVTVPCDGGISANTGQFQPRPMPD